MAFGPIMRLKVGELSIELAPLTKESMGEFISQENNGGMQQYEVHRYLGRNTAPVLEDEQDWFEKTRTAKDTLVWGIWVVDGESRTLIGNTAIVGIGSGDTGFIRQAETASMIFRQDYWGRGIASAIHKARTWFAFQQLGLHRLKSFVLQPNTASRRALERTGYIVTHTKRNDVYSNGKLLHLDCLECLNPLDLFWSQWWHDDTPPDASLEARKVTEDIMTWAEKNVTL